MFERFLPDERYPSAYEIPYEQLYEEGSRGLIFDIDNTLVPHGFPADERAVLLFAERTFTPGVQNVGAKGESVCSAPFFSQQLGYESRSGKAIIIGRWFCFYGLTVSLYTFKSNCVSII